MRRWHRIGIAAALLILPLTGTAARAQSAAPSSPALCPADAGASPAMRELCACPTLGIESERLQCYDAVMGATAPDPAGGYREISFIDLAVDGDALRHRRVKIAGFIMLTPNSVYLARSALEIASAVKVDIGDMPKATQRVLYETCSHGCQGVFTGTLEGTMKAPEIKADNALPPS